jgi:hypothetical protein
MEQQIMHKIMLIGTHALIIFILALGRKYIEKVGDECFNGHQYKRGLPIPPGLTMRC